MKVLVASINFAPDHAGIGIYSTDFAVYMAEMKNEVDVITGFSYYPHWRKRDSDKRKLFAREKYRGVDVYRGYLYVPTRVSTFSRLLHEATFCLFAAFNFFRVKRPDVLVVFSPPFFLGFFASIAARLWKCPLVINVQDLPLDAATALGMVKGKVVTQAMFALERKIYRSANQVATISDGMLAKIRAKGVSGDRSRLVPNWVDVKAFSGGETGCFRKRHPQAKSRFIVAYAGNLGVKQGVEVLIFLAKRMQGDRRFHFFVIGDGVDRLRLEVIASGLKLDNLTFLPFMHPQDYKEMLLDVDVMFVAQRSGAGDNFFPSKLLGLLAASKALLVAADEESELAKVTVDRGFGLVCKFDDLTSLERNLRTFADSPSFMLGARQNALKAVQCFDRATVLDEWKESIHRLLSIV